MYIKRAGISFYHLVTTETLHILTNFDRKEPEYHMGGGTRMTRGGIRLIHGLTKDTLNTYFTDLTL